MVGSGGGLDADERLEQATDPVASDQRAVSGDQTDTLPLAGDLGPVFDLFVVLGDVAGAVDVNAVLVGAFQHTDHLDAPMAVQRHRHAGRHA